MKVKSQYDIYVGEYPFHKQLYDEMVPILETYPDKHGRDTNVKATVTEWNFGLGGEYLQLNTLKKCIINVASNGHFKFSFNTPSFKALWGNIYHKGDYTQSHDHLYNQLSFVYFLKSKWYHSPLVLTYSGKKIQPKEGRYVLFPAHIKHHVPKQRFKETRITLSGDLS